MRPTSLSPNLYRSVEIFSAVIALLTWSLWLQIDNSLYYLQQHWEIALTMVFGSLIAGATSEGGGAIAFPVFTKLLQINPQDAKVFSLAIQSVGMVSASLTILYMRVKVAWQVIRWASLGGILGVLLGLIVMPLLAPAIVKMSFTAMITSFAITLFILNKKQNTWQKHLPLFNNKEKLFFLSIGFLGGIMSGLVGNGIDIITFSAMVLFFRLSEKIATPTSVILMAFNAVVGFSICIFLGTFSSDVQAYWLAAIPVVVVGAPLGAIICNFLERHIIAYILITLICIELISSLLLIELNLMTIVVSSITFFIFSGLYYWMYSRV